MAQAAQKTAFSSELMTAAQRKEVQEFRKAARAYTKKVTRSRKAALKSLVDAGIFTPKGNPRKQYR
jgi:hypothetical protein